MADEYPSAQFGEIVDATILLLQKPHTPIKDLMKIVPGPDFPTGGLYTVVPESNRPTKTGRGMLLMRARAAVDRVGRGGPRNAMPLLSPKFRIR